MEIEQGLPGAHSMPRRINKQSPIPMYYQIMRQIREKIDEGEYHSDYALPPERELAEYFHVSRMTVRQAILELVNEGILLRRKGIGTFVAPPKLEQELSGLTSFTEDMAKRGMKAESRVLSFTDAVPDSIVREALLLNENDRVYKCERLRLADREPMALEISMLSVQVCPGLCREDLENKSLYSLLNERWGLQLGRATQSLEPVLAAPHEARILRVSSGSPLLFMHRITYDQDEHPFEYAKSYYRGDRYKFITELRRKPIR